MDTRTKIITLQQAVEAAQRCRAGGAPVKLVTGFFDPLLEGAAARLEEIARDGGAVFVAVREPAEPILPSRARAELLAGLEAASYVVVEPASVDELLERISPDSVYREETADENRTRDFAGHVRRQCA